MNRLLPVLAFLLVVPVVGAQSGTVERLTARLPDQAEAPAAATDGRHVYVFGGYDGRDRSDVVSRFDPRTGALTTLGGRLPFKVHAMAAAFHGGQVYLFGGHGCLDQELTYCTKILRYDIRADRVVETKALLPRGFFHMSAASLGDFIYIAGGEQSGSGANAGFRSKDVFRFDPREERLSNTAGVLSEGTSQMGAVSTADAVYLFGGCDAKGECQRDWIWKYDAAADRLTQLPTRLPRTAYGISAAYDGKHVYLFGGEDYPDELDSVTRFDPATGGVTLLAAKLPSARFRTAAAWAEGAAYVFGGEIEDHKDETKSIRLDEILRFTPASNPSAEPTQEIREPERDGGGTGLPAPGVLLVALAVLATAALLKRR